MTAGESCALWGDLVPTDGLEAITAEEAHRIAEALRSIAGLPKPSPADHRTARSLQAIALGLEHHAPVLASHLDRDPLEHYKPNERRTP